MGKGADDRQGARRVHAVELLRQLLGAELAVSEIQGRGADVLDQVVGEFTFLLADHLAQNRAEIADVIPNGGMNGF